ncbi:MAG TPA: YSC84-related protein [Steroidobacteraceae bacterium]|jgi:lipid-binding SYLF domain-containing protein
MNAVKKVGVLTSALAGLAVFAGAAALAETPAEIDANVQTTLDKFYAEHHGDRELVNKAAGVLVFPRVTKGGAGVAGEHGEGALLIDGAVVEHYQVSGASVGATLGVAHRSEIILFMTREARDKFQNSKGWTIGADAGVAVAKVGAGGEYDSETLKRPIVAFVMDEHGLIADLSLEGAKVSRLPPKS